MTALGLVGLTVATLVLALLVVPLRLSLRLGGSPTTLHLAVGWPVPGLPDLRLTGRREARPSPAAVPSPARSSAEASLRNRRVARALRAAPRLLGSVLGALRVERLSLRGRFGTGDPALTGQIYGAVAPLAFGTSGSPVVGLALVPDFNGRCLVAEGKAVLRIRPIALVGPALRFVWDCHRSGR